MITNTEALEEETELVISSIGDRAAIIFSATSMPTMQVELHLHCHPYTHKELEEC